VTVEASTSFDSSAVVQAVEIYRPKAVIQVHLAVQGSVPRSWEDPDGTYGTNVVGTSKLLESLREHVQTRVLLVGSLRSEELSI
jgi:CDP-glucose 4,6-dehydratase